MRDRCRRPADRCQLFIFLGFAQPVRHLVEGKEQLINVTFAAHRKYPGIIPPGNASRGLHDIVHGARYKIGHDQANE